MRIWRCEQRGCGYWKPRHAGDEVPFCPYCQRPVRYADTKKGHYGPQRDIRLWEAVRCGAY